MIAAYAYSCDGAIAGSLASIPASKASIESWQAAGRRYVSVEPHQTITARDAPESAIRRRMSSRSCSARSRLFAARLTLGPSSRFTYERSKAAGMGSMAESRSRMGSRCLPSSTSARLGRLVRVVRKHVPAGELQVVQRREIQQILDQGIPVVGPRPQSDRLHLGDGPDRLRQSPPYRLDTRDEGGGYRSHSGKQDQELALVCDDG